MTATVAPPVSGGIHGTPPSPVRRRRRRAVRGVARSTPLLPAVVLLLVFLVGPIVQAFYGAFTNASLTGSAARNPQFVGLRNFTDLLTNDDFPKSVLLTLVFLVFSGIVGQNALGLALAMLLRVANGPIRFLVSTLVVGAWIMPEIVASFAAYAFFAKTGTLNAMLAGIGVAGPSWLYTFPMLSVILANIWRGTAFSMLMYSAAINDVPPEITESAEVDGATGWQRLVRITIPMIRRSISTNLMLTTLATLSVFTLIYVMTGGGPGTESATLPILAYQQAFSFSQLGFGTAIALILLLVGAVFSVVYIRALKPEID